MLQYHKPRFLELQYCIAYMMVFRFVPLYDIIMGLVDTRHLRIVA